LPEFNNISGLLAVEAGILMVRPLLEMITAQQGPNSHKGTHKDRWTVPVPMQDKKTVRDFIKICRCKITVTFFYLIDRKKIDTGT
jgi:hypothetical protein